jgi:beta-ribofuranosylaminobenzene 5'-phosphate synthase
LEGRVREVLVKAPSRLHFGIIGLGSDLGRVFGSVGVALSTPNVVLRFSPSKTLEVTGNQSERVAEMVKRFFNHYAIKEGCHIEVKYSIPAHIGLGSGTQTALAVAKSLAEIYGINTGLDELAVAMGRVSVSGVGIGVFGKGGFIIDAGYKVDKTGKMKIQRSSPPPLVFRHPFPEEWLFVVAIPSVERGLSGEEERKAFARLPEASAEHVGRMYRILYGSMVPSLIEGDIQTFGRSLTEFQIMTGKCFESIQGGIYSSVAAENCVRFMLKKGAYGAGQSSWGPTTYGLVHGRHEGERLMMEMHSLLESETGGEVFLTSANNRGVLIRRFQKT